MDHAEYWRECVAGAAEECGAVLTVEQINAIAGSVQGAHENYGMAFYNPPPSDRVHVVEREGAARLAALQKELDAYRAGAEKAVSRAMRLQSGTPIGISPNGEVYRYAGRIERIL